MRIYRGEQLSGKQGFDQEARRPERGIITRVGRCQLKVTLTIKVNLPVS